MRARLASLATIVALVAAAAFASGCGVTLDPVAQAATRSAKASTLRFTLSLSAQVPGAPAPVSFSATGAIDSAAERMTMTMDLTRVAALDPQESFPRHMTIVEDGLVMYLGGDGFGRVLPAGRHWARIDLSTAARKLGTDLPSLVTGQSDPRTSLAQLRDAGNVVQVGSGLVHGVPTTRYSVLLDLEKGLGSVPDSARDAVEQMLDRSPASRYVPADVWIDADGYLRRLRLSIPDYLGTGGSMKVTMELSDFGAPLNVVVPPAADVADAASLLGG